MAAVLVVALMLAAAAVPVGARSVAAASTGSVDIERYGGADRYATSLAIAEAMLADAGPMEWAVTVSGESWPDAVVASSLAGVLGAPVLLTPPGCLRDDTERFLQRAGATKLIVVGSADSPGVSEAVASALLAANRSVERVSGSTRSGTSVAVARRLGEVLRSRTGTSASVGSMPGFGPTAILASDESFADALVAGPVSARGHHPVLLTPPRHLDPEVSAYLAEAAVAHVVLMGGTAAVDASVERSLVALGLTVTRLAGETRFETAVLMSELIHGRYIEPDGGACFARADVGLARAHVPFDSFGAGPLLALRCAPLLLTDPTKTNGATSTRLGEIARSAADTGAVQLGVPVFGGDAAVSDAVLTGYFGTQAANPAPVPSASDICGASGGTRRSLAIDRPMHYAQWSRDCSRVAYLLPFGALWVANGDGSGAAELVPERRRVNWHAWSPDGSQIAFSAATGNGDDRVRHIYVINADGTRERRLTTGTVSDDEPSWSPDGRKLVFRRRDGAGMSHSAKASTQDVHLVTVNADGSGEQPLLVGGAHEELPAWSPDGTSIAYSSGGRIWVMGTDGSDPVIVALRAMGRGAKWSPDSQRVAFSRNLISSSGRTADIVVVDLDGLAEHRIPVDPDLFHAGNFFPNAAPQWSPDGRRVFFHLAAQNPFVVRGAATNWMHVIEVPGSDRLEPRDRTCRIKAGSYADTVGFPQPDWARSAVGTLRVAALFVDFPDAVATHSTQEESASSLAYFERYLETSSYGKLDVELVPHHVWLRSEHPVDHFAIVYGDRRPGDGFIFEEISDHAVALADDDYDFSDIDIVLTVMPSTLFGGGGNEGFDISADGSVMRAVRINHAPGVGSGGSLPGFNPWGPLAVQTVWSSFGLWTPSFYSPHREMLAWPRWQLGWLDASQVACLRADSASVRLKPPAAPGGGIAMAVVQESHYAALVVESRRLIGYDGSASPTRAGVLVYTVNSLRADNRIDDFQFLGVGESVSVSGYAVTVVSDTGAEHVVTIRKEN